MMNEQQPQPNKTCLDALDAGQLIAWRDGAMPPEEAHEAAALTVEELGEQAPPGPLVARLRDDKAVELEAAQMPRKPSHPDVLPSLPFTLRRAMQIEVLGDRYHLQDPIGRGSLPDTFVQAAVKPL